MELLDGAMRHYQWGSRTLLAHLRGADAPSPRPEAEMWFGAHPGAPATIGGRSLTDIIAADPVAALGEAVAARYHGNLPFLAKLLAAGEPLSLQAHPSKAQAEDGFARDNAAGLAADAPDRNYRDDNHKPEVIVALTDFEALSGFRPLARTRQLCEQLNCPELNHYAGELSGDGDLRALFTTWITIPTAARTELIDAIVACVAPHLEREDWVGDVLRVITDLNRRYPGDVGVLGALLLNHFSLAPGEAAYTDAGQLHAYLCGLGVEVMANSDNVLRGGLTAKYVDVPELVRVLDFAPKEDPRVPCGADGVYATPTSEFVVRRVRLAAEQELIVGDPAGAAAGPKVVVCTAGGAQYPGGRVGPAQALWVPASELAAASAERRLVAGDAGAELFVIGVGSE